MHQTISSLPDRIRKTLPRIEAAIHSHRTPVSVFARPVDGEPISFDEALAGEFTPFAIGSDWGRAWSTWWFRLEVTLPPDYPQGVRLELDIDLGFSDVEPGMQVEALAWDVSGRPIKGLHPRNRYLVVPAELDASDTWTVYLEAAANPAIRGPVDALFSDVDLVPDRSLYTFRQADLTVFHPEVFALALDLRVLSELAAELPDGSPRRAALYTSIQQALDLLDLHAIAETATATRAVLAPALSSPASASEHTVSAVGHAHIDSAWLWPIRETVRKCSRTFSNITALAKEYPDLVFVCSQAVQYSWMRDRYPEVFARMKEAIADGTWTPVGGMWVEMDANLTGGEAMVRQFVHGKRFFRDELGFDTHEVWLPDTFGYSAALPQICRLTENRWFLSQKMSWNTTDPFPHHTFWWEGIDGSRVFCHFPPSDTYNSVLSAAEVHRSAYNFRDAGPANESLLAYGYGDGGGGPVREMVEVARRLRDLEGSPRVVMEKPSEFFTRAEAEYDTAPVWVGEMYLEFHRGTYTSQIETKQGNRRVEHLLTEAEIWAASATVLRGAPYPYDELDSLWKEALLMQFHDILPGSSIHWVHREAEATFADLTERLESLIVGSLRLLAGEGSQTLIVNPAPHARRGVPARGARPADAPRAGGTVTIRALDDGWELRNGLVTVTIAQDVTIRSIRTMDGREVLPEGARGNLLQLHPDFPIRYEAWDIDEYYRHRVTDADMVQEAWAEGSTLYVRRRFGASEAVQSVSLAPDAARIDCALDLDWHEQETLLKVTFPVDVHTTIATSEIQFGHLARAIHQNTSWDAARFETPAQRWVHVGEPGFGVALINRGTYGYDISRSESGSSRGAQPTIMRLTLARGAVYPDPVADQGVHRFEYSLLVGAGIPDALREGYAKAMPERAAVGTGFDPVVTCDNDGVVVSAVKLADDRSGDLIVRLYEALGQRSTATVSFGFPVESVAVVNLLERPDGTSELLTSLTSNGNSTALPLTPFQILTLRVRREA